jgi:tetratricopeptide (TPR) repeat protein
MQALNLKKIIFLFFSFFVFSQLAISQGNGYSLNKADSLFKKQNFSLAEKIYEQKLNNFSDPPYLISLKLAYIKEQKGDYLKALYFLNKCFEKKPDEKILAKLNELSIQHELKGYELSDFNFLILIYKQYSGFLFGLMMLLAIYIFGIIVYKRYKKENIPFKQKMFLVFYLIGIATLLNVPNLYHQGIVNSDGVMIRTEPSAGALVSEKINKGNKLDVIGNKDIWKRVYWNGEIGYIKENDLWLVE